MKNITHKNIQKFPDVEAGTSVQILDSKMSILNGAEGVVVEAPKSARSPHKAIYKVLVEGKYSANNPFYLFRTEFQPKDSHE